MKISELFEFEDIQKVIEIGKIKDEQEMVEKFVISHNLEEDILEFLEYLKGNKKEDNVSLNIIGNYGTGKSHLLAFISLILSKPELIQYIQNDRIREEFQNLGRSFLIVKYELPAVQKKSLASIFFYRVRKQLEENYGVEIRPMDLENDEKDTKELMEEILLKIKEKYPTHGLIVIFDEFSDFIKQKHSADQNHDLQFTRQIAECSMDMDFILMISMQEHIFSNPEYMDKAELISKIEKRFLKVNITSENVEDIISNRIVRKNSNQVQELKKLFGDLKDKFSNLALEEDRYIKLFPVHPYVIEIFSKLPYFENRSILQFISYQVRKIMDKEFPDFITFDLIYDEMVDSDHNVRNHPDVKPVLDIVKSLNDIINRIKPIYKERAIILVKSLAILNLVGIKNKDGKKRKGETPEKLAENLFMIPQSSVMDPTEDIKTILKMLIKKSEGQFIGEENEVYFIDLRKKINYWQIIDNKATNMNDLPFINQNFVESFLLDELDVSHDKDIYYWDNSRKYILNDSVNWKERSSFRRGILTIDIGYKLKIDDYGDYIITILGFGKRDVDTHSSRNIIIKPDYDDDLAWSIKRLAAINEFIRTRTHLEAMKNKKRTVIDEELKNGFRKALKTSEIEYDGKTYSLEDIGVNSEINTEILDQIKENLLGEELTNEYPEYPRFKSKLSAENIKGTVENIFRDISQKEGMVKDLLNQSTNLLIPLGLYRNGMLDVNESQYAKHVLDKLDDETTNLAVEDVVKDFENKPYGLQREIVYLILAVLLRNGNIMLSSKHGRTYSSSDFTELFGSGLTSFENIKYLKKEEGPGPEAHLLFEALDLNRSLLQISKDLPIAYRNYMEKIEKIERELRRISEDFNDIKNSFDIGLPLTDIKAKINFLDEVDFNGLKIKNINELNKLDYSKERLNQIKKGYQLIGKIRGLFDDCYDFLLPGMKYMDDALDWMDNDCFKTGDKDKLNEIYHDSKEIVFNIRKLLKEDERKPLKGKIELFKEKYKEIYYHTHKELVGEGVDWESLDELERSETFQTLNMLKDVRSISPTNFREIQLQIKDLRDVRCTSFKVDELDTTYRCHCNFPQGHYDPNINQTISKLTKKVEKLKENWETQILRDITENRDKLSQLDNSERVILDEIISENALPKIMNYESVKAINNLLDDIEMININLDELYQVLTSEKELLKVEEFKKMVEGYIDEHLTSYNDKEGNVRINVIKG